MALNPRDENLLWVGTEIFPALISSVKDQTPTQDRIAVIYDNNPMHANIIAEQLRKKLSHDILVVSQQQFLASNDFQYSFICHPSLTNSELLDHINKNNMLSFSPFINALELGIDSGILVTNQVRPRLHLQQINSKKIWLKPFFIQVSVIYEP